jgi:hypothetical protein
LQSLIDDVILLPRYANISQLHTKVSSGGFNIQEMILIPVYFVLSLETVVIRYNDLPSTISIMRCWMAEIHVAWKPTDVCLSLKLNCEDPL